MPELPEVETIVKGLSVIIGKKITNFRVFDPKFQPKDPTNPNRSILLNKLIVGKEIQDVCRRGKFIVIKFESGNLILHLRMSGSLTLSDQDSSTTRLFTRVEFNISENLVLRFHSRRRLGTLEWIDLESGEHSEITNLGRDPYDDDFTGSYLYDESRTSKRRVKDLLLDGKFVAGLGNIYATEALFRVNIHPHRLARGINRDEYDNLATEIRTTLDNGNASHGISLLEYVDVSGKPGLFEPRDYGCEGQPCPNCDSAVVKISENSGRSGYCCPECQKL